MSAHVAEEVLEETFIAEIGRRDEFVYGVAAFVHSEKGAVKNVQLTFTGARGDTMADVILSPDDARAVLNVLGAVLPYLD
jgi:hypothetical protein